MGKFQKGEISIGKSPKTRDFNRKVTESDQKVTESDRK